MHERGIDYVYFIYYIIFRIHMLLYFHEGICL